MNRILNLLTALLTTGADHQSFIGAKWLVLLLKIAPHPLKRPLALRILALSPHYFYRHITPQYKTMPVNDWLEAEYERNRSTRAKLCDQILLPYLKSAGRVLDIGCGPGFLAQAAAPHVGALYACDISRGVLECARVINNAPNIHYIYSGPSGFDQIPDSSLDLIYSFAVIQHLREPVIQSLFQVTGRKLRKGGRCLFQVQLDDDKWKPESEWAADQTVTGRLKLKYALNFFSRSPEFFRTQAAAAGLSLDAIRPLSEIMDQPFDDVYHQHLIELTKL